MILNKIFNWENHKLVNKVAPIAQEVIAKQANQKVYRIGKLWLTNKLGLETRVILNDNQFDLLVSKLTKFYKNNNCVLINTPCYIELKQI